MRTVCTSCGAAGMEVFHTIDRVPTNSCILLPTREEALSYPCGDVRLAFCRRCGFISNVAFDPRLTEYSGRYEETQAFSPTFNAFHEKLAHALVERHNLHGKELIEIGCGKGEFLRLLCDLGANRGLGRHFARAHRCRGFPEIASFGHDALAHQTYYGLRLHLCVTWLTEF